uniref:Sterol regulatory element-binding protein cleavage-activating protein n=1 Tax=Acrobeloides nanus TaxID=290746 RepID=A0A914C9U1_9BILA
MFNKKPQKLSRTFSESNVRMAGDLKAASGSVRTHRRTMSTDKINVSEFEGKEEIRVRKKYVRLWVLYYWTKTRFVQRMVMAFFALWVLCFGFLAHKFRLFDNLSSINSSVDDGFGVGHRILEMAPLEWGEWQRHTFNWWPVVFSEYNLTLSGRYITFIPPIVLSAEIPPDDLSLTYTYTKGGAPQTTLLHPEFSTTTPSNEYLKYRVYSLERQMAWMLVGSILLLFSVVISFILYVCFWDKWVSYRLAKKSAANQQQAQNKMQENKHMVELVPLAFFKHESPVECVSVLRPNTVVSASLDGRVLVWDAQSGVLKRNLTRAGISPNPSTENIARSRVSSTASNLEPQSRSSDPQLRQRSSASISIVRPSTAPNNSTPPTSGFTFLSEFNNKPPRSQIWCMCIKQSFVALGCSNGAVEISKWTDGQVLTSYDASNVGVLHITIRGNRIILVRLNGSLEILELTFSHRPEDPLKIHRLVALKAHQEPVTQLLCASYYAITASHDHTIKAFDIRTMRPSYILVGHNATVTSLCADEQINTLYSCCEEGMICYWDLDEGQLVRSLENDTGEPVDLACTSQLLIGYGSGLYFYLWDKFNGQLVTRITPAISEIVSDESRCIVVLNDQFVVTSNGKFVQFWDVDCKAIIRQLKLPGIVDSLHQLENNSVLCCSSNNMYRVNLLTTRESSKQN